MSQTKSCNNDIYIDAEKRKFEFDTLFDTLYINTHALYFLKVFISDCRGSMYMEKRRITDSSLVLKGFYRAGLRRFRDTILLPDLNIDPYGTKFTKFISYYYRPKRIGIWRFYNSKGKLIRTIYY